MVRMRSLVKVGNREVKKRYVGNKLIFENLKDKTDILSGIEIYTDKADDSVVHVEMDGKSYQDGVPTPDNPSEIHSLNDFDVVSSVGKRNLFSMSKFVPSNSTEKTNTGFILPSSGWGANWYDIDIKKNTTFTISAKIDGSLTIAFYSDTNEIKRHRYLDGEVVKTENLSSDIKRIRFLNSTHSNGFNTYVENLKLEKGNKATDWTPAPEDILEDNNHPLIDKINILLDEPLRSVGDIKDRLFRDSEGLWKIERNVELIHPEDGTKTIEETYGVLDSPFYEILPQDYQDKLNNLRSFEDSNYVYTVSNNDISPTLHAKFKSKGWYDYYQKTLLK